MGETQAEASADRVTPIMTVDPTKEHRWLQQLVGEWTYEANAAATPGQPASRATGTETVRSIGGIWVLAEGHGEAPGAGQATTVMTLGFDPQRARFIGTWIGSMMTHMWIYEGGLDQSGRILTLDSEGPSMADDGTTSRYQDVIEFKRPDHRTLTSRVLGPDGTWTSFMTAEYRRAT
jgi:hypothetical protein